MQEDLRTFQEELHKTSDRTSIVAPSIDTTIKLERLGTLNGEVYLLRVRDQAWVERAT